MSRDREALEAQLALERAERAQEAAAAAAAERAARAELEDALRAAAQRTAALDAEVSSLTQQGVATTLATCSPLALNYKTPCKLPRCGLHRFV